MWRLRCRSRKNRRLEKDALTMFGSMFNKQPGLECSAPGRPGFTVASRINITPLLLACSRGGQQTHLPAEDAFQQFRVLLKIVGEILSSRNSRSRFSVSLRASSREWTVTVLKSW